MSPIPGDLRQVFLDTCRMRQLDPSDGLREAIAEWTGLRGRQSQRSRRFLSAQLVAAIRARREVSQNDVAKRCGVCAVQLSQWLNRRVPVPENERATVIVERLCAFVNVPVADAFEIPASINRMKEAA